MISNISAELETKYGNPGVARDMSTAALNSGQPYQRPVHPAKVNKLIRNWDDHYLTPIIVSYRDDSFNVVDGQRRINALRKMNGGKHVTVPCLIYTGLTYEQEAEMYYMLDKTTGHLSLPNSTKALLESGKDPAIAAVKQCIERAGFTWALDKPTNAAYEIKPTRAVISAFKLLGEPAFSRMLGLLGGAWHGVQPSLSGGMIAGMALFLKLHEQELDDYEFIRRLSEVDPVEIAQLAHVDSPNIRYARLIRSKYNEQGGKELPERFQV